MDGSPHFTGHGHGVGDLRKKNSSFHPLTERGSPLMSAPVESLPRNQYHPLSLCAHSEKKCRNTASDGGTPARWERTRKPVMTRHLLGVIWLGATVGAAL